MPKRGSMLYRIVTVAFALALLAGQRITPTPLSYTPTIVHLVGTITIEQYYGPPNYGQTREVDAIERWPILKLDESIRVAGDPAREVNSDSFDDVTRIQLLGTAGVKLIEGQHVAADGVLFEKFNGHHHTDVVMSVKKIR